ncbi:hypothetical protein [Streptomyces sp. NPDC091215]|uniref:hypothetical protein n=1 Tax=Streptomyces sp. NPDC091215 TaxID=3155192 RepID=UPI003429BA33
MPLFTGPVDDPLAFNNNAPMQDALDATWQQLSNAGTPTVDDLAVIVVALTGFEGGLNHPWAAIRDQDECYSASLIKIAAMYTAFDLRASADQLATDPDQGLTTWPDIEAALQATFDPDIAKHTPSLINASTDLRDEDKDRRPDYSAVLQLGAPGGDFTVDFTPGQVSAFENMMVQQHDQGATTTIHGLGYPYIDGKIADDGFFDSTSSEGLWLAGDYAGIWPAARISCVNDVDTAQGTTARQLARLLTLLADDKLVGKLSSQGMKELMARAGKFFESTTPPDLALRRTVCRHPRQGRHGPVEDQPDRDVRGDSRQRHRTEQELRRCLPERDSGRSDKAPGTCAGGDADRSCPERLLTSTRDRYG